MVLALAGMCQILLFKIENFNIDLIFIAKYFFLVAMKT